MRTLRKLLIANRGEIALRIARTAARMGIGTVAVFSDADEDALFVRRADEAVRIGPAPARDSYLRIDRILDAARRTGADAVHPGFGFLAENADFAEAVESAGLLFIGPSAAAIRAMGLKREAKAIALRVGVPVVPGFSDLASDLEGLDAQARTLGYPVLLKASAGGGGKGMRVVHGAAGLEEAVSSARREAEAAFGDGTLLLEKYIEGPRHVEIQVLGDTHGHLVHLFERECSIQRRHQKLIEESPSTALDDARRRAMGRDAIALCAAIGYTNAGTVEFVLDAEGNHHFLEVNTRLQVEHPVTEGVFEGLDLVEEQIRIARGERLRFTQADLDARRSGAAVECRLCAEDPDSEFLPQSGRIIDFHLPEALLAQEWLRVESGVETGSDVPVHYDSMIAKLITRGPTRQDAIARMIRALSSLSVQGVLTNRAFLLRVLSHPDYQRGDIDTHFIETRMPPAVEPAEGDEILRRAAVAAALAGHATRAPHAAWLPSLAVSGYRNHRVADERVEFEVPDRGTVQVGYVDLGRGAFRVRVEGGAGTMTGTVRRVASDAGDLVLEWPDGHRVPTRVRSDGDAWYVHALGHSTRLRERPRFLDRDADSAADGCVAPMPGKILAVRVALGQTVAAGDTLMIIEAMKMEHAVKAPHAGVVSALPVRAGDQVAGGATLAVIDAT